MRGRTDLFESPSPALERAEPAGSYRGARLLLVACDPRWTQAVAAAAATLPDLSVSTCDARSALMRLAGGERVSFLLVEEHCASGLLDELADLAGSNAARSTRLVILGGTPRKGMSGVPVADAAAVRRALVPGADEAPPDPQPVHATDLHDALSVPLIAARYQPIVRICDRRPVALEALARMHHPAHGTLLPGGFVPQMEDAGLAGPLTKLICSLVFADLGTSALSGAGLAVTLNFPLDVLLCDVALGTLDAQRQAAGLSAAQIVVELTESRPVDDLPALRRSLERLRRLGYGVAIDDAGPAVPDLAPLLDLPFTCVKLDKTIVQGSEHSAKALDFLQRTAAAAQARGMQVVAEGIENGTVWDLMLSLGIDHAQGFFVARPLPATAVPVWLDAWSGVPPA